MTPYAAAEFVMLTLGKAGYQAFLAGGCVRDLHIGRTPNDYDVTTNARPEQVTALFEKTIPVGAKFGVVVVMVEGNQIEVATFRADGAYSDGRRPDEVRYSESAKEDVQRRDFTINGLLQPTSALAFSEEFKKDVKWFQDGGDEVPVIDYVGGLDDLKDGTIRCIGDATKRFEEDALRMMRACRFVSRFGFEVERDTFKAILDNADGIKNVSRERIADELKEICIGKFAAKGLTLLATTGLLRRILPEGVSDTRFVYTLERFTKFQTSDPLMGLAMLLADVQTSEAANKVVESLKLSNEEAAVIMGAVRNCGSGKEIGTVGYAGSDEFYFPAGVKMLAREKGILPYAVDVFEQNLKLGYTLLTSEAGKKAIERFRALTPEEVRPTLMVTGKDLIAMGFPQSPMFTKVLNLTELRQLNGEFSTREDALEFAKQTAEAE